MRLNSQGKYVYVMDQHNNPMADKRGRVLFHRFLLSHHLGRYLTKDEHVHHIDGNCRNNIVSNLELTSNKLHIRRHINKPKCIKELTCYFCGELFFREKKNIHPGNTYCSRSCLVKQQHKNKRPLFA